MARSIVLRFDATCFDCGRSLSAGTTARWFGRGRVSCCGGAAAKLDTSGTIANGVVTRDPAPRCSVRGCTFPAAIPGGRCAQCAADRADTPPKVAPPGDSASIYRAARDAAFPSPFPPNPHAPVANVDERELGAELARALQCGLSPQHLTKLASVRPTQPLCVRLTSGARFNVMARDAAHMIACVTESCRDRVRDVMGAAL